MNFFNIFTRFKKKPTVKPKIGLALGSGGAKGMAHLGALKAFEENDITFDVVSGTSIGSIIGSLYAKGFSATDIIELLKTVNMSDITRFIMIKMDMGKAQKVIDDILGELSIEDLNLPYAAIATELKTGKEIVLTKGSAARAVSASSAMPPFFKPVEIDGRFLIDGAYVNAVPSDAAKNLGADYVVGIDLSAYKLNETTNRSLLLELFGVNITPAADARKKGYLHADVMLTPDLKSFKATSLSGSEEMFEAGYKAAMEQMDKIKADISELSKVNK